MSKTIKIEDQAHRELEELRGKRETFSDTVVRLIQFYRHITREVWSHSGDHPRIPGQGA